MPPPRVDRGVRRRNLEAALQHVYRERPTTRARLARHTGLTRATVSDLVAELLHADLVREVGFGTSSGGKPPTLIELNATARQMVAIDLSRQPFRGALVDMAGRIGPRARGRRGSVRGPAGLREVFRLVDSLLEGASAPVLGIGVGTPGIVDPGGAVVEASNLEWHGVPLRQELSQRAGLPVTVANDAHAGALAEYGAHAGGDLVLVKVGVGIGAGLVVDGRLHRGDRPAAGEIGHIRVVERGVRCRCGNRGCLETVASVPTILRRAAVLARRDPADADGLAWDAAVAAGELGAKPVATAVAEAARSLGGVLAHMVAILDIHRVVLALELTGAEEQFLRALRTEVAGRLLPDLASVVSFAPSTAGDDLVLSGAAALVLQEQLGVVWR